MPSEPRQLIRLGQRGRVYRGGPGRAKLRLLVNGRSGGGGLRFEAEQAAQASYAGAHAASTRAGSAVLTDFRPVMRSCSAPYQHSKRTSMPWSVLESERIWPGNISWVRSQTVQWWVNTGGPLRLVRR